MERGGRSVIAGVAESESPAVERRQPVSASVRGDRYPDNPTVEMERCGGALIARRAGGENGPAFTSLPVSETGGPEGEVQAG